MTMYLATLDCATSNPSLSSSPWIRGAPQSGFSTLIRRINTRKLRLDLRSPFPWARLPTPVAAKAGSVPTQERLRPDDCENLQDCWKPAIQLDKEQAIMVREPDATMRPAPQDNQLMSKHRVLSFKPQLRLEWRGQDDQNETEQPNHSASLSDSITSSTRMRFSVHTPGSQPPWSLGAGSASPRHRSCQCQANPRPHPRSCSRSGALRQCQRAWSAVSQLELSDISVFGERSNHTSAAKFTMANAKGP